MICPPKIPKILICENCDYSSSRKYQYIRHLSTHKHKILTNTDVLGKLSAKNSQIVAAVILGPTSYIAKHNLILTS